MDDEKLKDYIAKQLFLSRSFLDIKSELLNYGVSEEKINRLFYELTQPKKKRSILKYLLIILIVFILFIVAVVAYIYFYYISNPFISKPIAEKPELIVNSSLLNIISDNNLINSNLNNATDQNITLKSKKIFIISPKHVAYLLNELGTWKLHNSPTGEHPFIRILINDQNQEFLFMAKSGELPILTDSNAPSDILLELDSNIVALIYNESSKQKRSEMVRGFINSGDIKFTALKDLSTLALKGYVDLAKEAGIPLTGVNMSPSKESFNKIYIIFFILIVILIYSLLKKKLK